MLEAPPPIRAKNSISAASLLLLEPTSEQGESGPLGRPAPDSANRDAPCARAWKKAPSASEDGGASHPRTVLELGEDVGLLCDRRLGDVDNEDNITAGKSSLVSLISNGFVGVVPLAAGVEEDVLPALTGGPSLADEAAELPSVVAELPSVVVGVEGVPRTTDLGESVADLCSLRLLCRRLLPLCPLWCLLLLVLLRNPLWAPMGSSVMDKYEGESIT